MQRVFVKIYGDVQGVNFRNFILRQATALNIVGWAKNVSDGTVEAVFEGEEDVLRKIIELCRQGPDFSKVNKLSECWQEAGKEFKDFIIEY